jgi:hypothetical protein
MREEWPGERKDEEGNKPYTPVVSSPNINPGDGYVR